MVNGVCDNAGARASATLHDLCAAAAAASIVASVVKLQWRASERGR